MAGVQDPLYNPDLTYEERSRLRKLKREKKSLSDLESSGGSTASTSSRVSSSSNYSSRITTTPPRSVPTAPPTQKHITNGSVHKTTPTTSAPVTLRNGTISVNGTTHNASPTASKATPSSRSGSTHQTRQLGGGGGAKKPGTKGPSLPEGTVIRNGKKLAPTPLRLTGTRQLSSPSSSPQPERSSSHSPPFQRSSHSPNDGPQSPHSPIVVGMASRHLAGIIARKQEREHSSSPLTTPTDNGRFGSSGPSFGKSGSNDIRSGAAGNKESSNFTVSATIRHTPSPTTLRSADSASRTNTSNSSYSRSNSKSSDYTSNSYSRSASKQSDSVTNSSRANSKLSDLGELPPEFQHLEFTSPSMTATHVDVDDRTSSRLSTLSSSSSFTFDNFDQLMSPGGFKSETPPFPASFAAGLMFVDTDSPGSPSSPLKEPASIRGPMQKTVVVYGSHDDDQDVAVTRIPGSGFFDPSQSQADVLSPTMGTSGSVGLIDTKSPAEATRGSSEEKKKARDSKRAKKSPLRHFMKGDKIIEEDEESEQSGKVLSGRGKAISSSARKEKEPKKKSPKKRSESMYVSTDISSGGTDLAPESRQLNSAIRKVSSGSLVPTSPQHGSPFLKSAVSQSFREESPRDRSLSPDSKGLSKVSMPNLSASPSKSSSQSREVTPESASSDGGSGTWGRKRKPSFAQRLKNLVTGGGKEEAKSDKPSMANPVVLKTYTKFEEVAEIDSSPPPGKSFNSIPENDVLDQSRSEPLLRVTDMEDSISEVESSVELTKDLLQRTDSKTSITSTKSAKSAKSTPKKKSSSDSRKKSLDSPKKSSSFGKGSPSKGSRQTASSSSLSSVSHKSSPATARRTSGGNVSSKASPMSTRRASGGVLAGKASPSRDGMTNKSTPGSSQRGSGVTVTSSPTSARRGSAQTGKSSPGSGKSSPVTGGKSSPMSPRRVSPYLEKPSPVSSPLTTRRVSSSPPGKVTSATTAAGARNKSPTKSTATSTVVTTPSGTNHSPVITKKVTVKSLKTSSTSSPKNTPTGPRKVSSTSSSAKEVSKSSSGSSPYEEPSSKLSPKSSSKITVNTTKVSPTGSPSAPKRTIVSSSIPSKASPLLQRKSSADPPSSLVTSSSKSSLSSLSSSRTGNSSPPQGVSPRSSYRKPAPPRLAKVSLDASNSVSSSSKAGTSSPKTGNSPQSSVRRPAGPRLTKVTLDTSRPQDSPTVSASPSFQRFSKSRQPIKIPSKSPDQSKMPSPTPKHTPMQSHEQLRPQALGEDLSSPGTPGTKKRRRVGLSLSESPLPSPSPTTSNPFLYLPESEAPPNSNSMVTGSSNLNMSIENLLADVEKKLNKIATPKQSSVGDSSSSAGESEDPLSSIPDELKSSSVFDLTSPVSLQSSVEVALPDSPSSPITSPPPFERAVKAKPSSGTASSSKEARASGSKKNLTPSTTSSRKSPTMARKESGGGSMGASKSESTLKSFTSARPPKPPSKKTSEPPSSPIKKVSSGSKQPVSSTGVSRPRLMVLAETNKGASKNKKTSVPSLSISASESHNDTSMKSKSSSDILRSSTAPKTDSSSRNSTLNRSMKSRASSRIRPSSANTSSRRYSVAPVPSAPATLRRQTPPGSNPTAPTSTGIATGTAARKSMRRGSAAAVSTSGLTAGTSARKSVRRGSVAVLSAGTGARKSMRKGSTAVTSTPSIAKGTPARKSMRRVSSSEEILTKKIRPTVGARERQTANADDEDPTTSSAKSGAVGGRKSVVEKTAYASMRRPRSSTLSRPSVSGLTTATNNSNFTRSATASKSMRLPRNSVVGDRNSTLRRSSKVGSPLHTSKTDTSLSPSRTNTLKRMNSGGTLRKNSVSPGEVLAAFDHISAQASILPSSDHRRAVRPKFRQKASTTHLKMLHQRADVSSDIIPSEEASAKLDPNSYSTYMAKKNLAPSAMAGLAASVDFSTVKLRKTSTVQQMMSEGGSNSPIDSSRAGASAGSAGGANYNTSHPVMLLQIKGRKNIQTRLVEHSADSLNSGDVFVAVSKDKLFEWVGKSSNVIERARGSDVVMRIIHKKELGCKATASVIIKEEERNQNSKRADAFWEMIGGKKPVKSSESVPGDEVHEKAVNLATVAYQLEGDPETAQFVPIHEGTAKMLSVNILQTKQILLFDFYGEVYVWIGNQSPANMRKKAMELGRQIFDAGCRPPVFNLRCSPARASGRYRPRLSTTSKSPRHSVVNASGRRVSKVSKEMKPRPTWALFGRQTEGSEHILFREKFGDWPEQGRIIKMKGHDTKPRFPAPVIEFKPADVDKMLKDPPAFEGLRLEGDNIHRGLGNYKVSKSSFSCNRVRTVEVKKWVIKEFDNILVPQQHQGLFYTAEAYVVRWGFQISVVRELEGLTPGKGMFARDREYQRSLQAAREGKSAQAPPADKKRRAAAAAGEEGGVTDSDDSEDESEEEKGLLESGGRDRCAYFFWQGDDSTVNEKGASALMTVELDKEKGPQVRVTQGKEPPAFLSLFNGGMIILQGRSDTNSLQSKSRQARIFCAHMQQKNEACLVECTPSDERVCLGTQLRSRGAYVVYHVRQNRLFLWYGSKAPPQLKKSSTRAARMLRNRYAQ